MVMSTCCARLVDRSAWLRRLGVRVRVRVWIRFRVRDRDRDKVSVRVRVRIRARDRDRVSLVDRSAVLGRSTSLSSGGAAGSRSLPCAPPG